MKKTENAEVKMGAGAPTYPVGTIAKLLMLSERRVQQLTQEGVIPRAERGRYELAPSVQGYIRYLQERSIGTESVPEDYQKEKSRLTRMQADKVEIELGKARGEVAELKLIERILANLFAEIRVNLRNLPGRLVSQLIGETNERRFKQVMLGEIDQVLMALSDFKIQEVAQEEDPDLDENEE